MYDILGKSWWALMVRGVAAVIFGILAIVWPGHALVVLVLLYGAYALVDGVFSLVAAVRAAEHHLHWMALVAEGILGVIVGVIVLVNPGIAIIAFAFVVGAWAIITGILELVAAIRLRRELSGEILLALSGIASLIFGVLLFILPGRGILAVVWILGIYALIFGVLMIALSLRLRSHQHEGGNAPQAAEGSA